MPTERLPSYTLCDVASSLCASTAFDTTYDVVPRNAIAPMHVPGTALL